MATTYPLFSIGNHSKSANLTAAHRLNIYYDVQSAGDKTNVAAYGTPGLTSFGNVSAWRTLGMWWLTSNNKFFAIQGDGLWEIFNDGSSKRIATLTAVPPGKVSMADNGTQLAIFAGEYAYIYDTKSGIFTDISENLPWVNNAGVEITGSSVTFLDGRFIAVRPDTGQFYLSKLYDGMVWDALDFATAESNPDPLVAVIADKGNLALLGASSIELWANNGDVLFPYQRINAAPSDGGLAARWSLAKCKGAITGLFRNRSGALAVCVLNGYNLEPISTPEMDYLFNNYLTPTDAIGFSYTMNGRAFYQITFQAQVITWLYDFTSGAWSQLKSNGTDRHWGDMCAAFDMKVVVSDYRDGNLYMLDADVFTDNGATIEREIIGSHVYMSSQNYMAISRLIVDLESGVGLVSGQGSDPKIMLSISRDHGHTWGRELVTGFGKLGEYKKQAEWRKLGMARDWVFKLRITDPVKVCIIAAVMEGKELAR